MITKFRLTEVDTKVFTKWVLVPIPDSYSAIAPLSPLENLRLQRKDQL